MKKIVAWIVALVLVFSCMYAVAEVAEIEGEQAQNNSNESEFERVLLKKGSLIIKEFINYGELGDMTLQSASVLDVETGSKFYAIRISVYYYNSKYDKGTAVGVMDADEIDGAISTLEYIKAHVTELKDYSEIEYTASSGMQVGAYHSSQANKVFIKVDNNDTEFFEINEIDAIITAFKGVRDMFEE